MIYLVQSNTERNLWHNSIKQMVSYLHANYPVL